MGNKPIIEPTLPFKFHIGEEVRHLTTQDIYLIQSLPDVNRLAETGEPAYGYLSYLGYVWYRSQSEMEDGRFRSLYSIEETT